MSIDQLVNLPARNQAPATFITNANAIWPQLNTYAAQANALAAGLSAIAAGTALNIPYTFSTTTTDSDPGAGILRLGSATQNAATVIRADLLSSDTTDRTTTLDTFDDSTSTVKGQLTLVKISDPTKWLSFNVSAVASPSGYRNITVANIGSSTANPFSNSDSIILLFTRTGDIGSAGTSSPFTPGMSASRYYTYPLIATATSRTIAAQDRLYAIPVFVSGTNTFTKIGINVSNGVGGNARLGIYNINSSGLPSSLVLDAGAVSTATSGEKEISISQSLSLGWYYLGCVFSATSSDVTEFGTVTGGSFFSGGISSATDFATYMPYVSSTYGVLPSTFGTPTMANITTAHPMLWVRI